MKSVELLETIGEVRNEYIQDILIPPKEEASTRRRTRLPFSLLVAVMIFSSLIAATAYASDFRISDWFQSLFGELTPGQSQVLEGMGMDQNNGVVSATSNGNSVTVVSAFGDSYNDLSMIQYAGLGVAMGNAKDVVKENADFIAKTNDEDGIVDVINKFVLD